MPKVAVTDRTLPIGAGVVAQREGNCLTLPPPVSSISRANWGLVRKPYLLRAPLPPHGVVQHRPIPGAGTVPGPAALSPGLVALRNFQKNSYLATFQSVPPYPSILPCCTPTEFGHRHLLQISRVSSFPPAPPSVSPRCFPPRSGPHGTSRTRSASADDRWTVIAVPRSGLTISPARSASMPAVQCAPFGAISNPFRYIQRPPIDSGFRIGAQRRVQAMHLEVQTSGRMPFRPTGPLPMA